MVSDEQASAVKERHSARLLATPGVCGVGVERHPDGGARLVVHLDADAAHLERELPAELEGVPVRYVADGPFRAFPAR